MQQVTLIFDAKEYVVPENKCWGLIEAIEEVVTLSWLAPKLQEQQIPMAKVFRGYAAALTYAGAKDVTVDAIREGVDYPRAFQMAYELAGILSLAAPATDANLSKVSDKQVEEVKKKPTARPRKSASKRG